MKADKIESLWLKGLTVWEIADTVNCNRSYVQFVARKRGLPSRYLRTRKNDPLRKDMWPCILYWIKKGFTEDQIKIGLGYNQRTEE